MIIENPYTGIMVKITNNSITGEISKPIKPSLIKGIHALEGRLGNEKITCYLGNITVLKKTWHQNIIMV